MVEKLIGLSRRRRLRNTKISFDTTFVNATLVWLSYYYNGNVLRSYYITYLVCKIKNVIDTAKDSEIIEND